MVYCILYFIGVAICFCLLDKQYKEYKANHPEKHQTREERQYAHSMMIITSLFSWLSLVALLAGNFCAYGNGGNGDDKDEYMDDIEDSDSY